jgi:phosphatidylglycerophosphatase C
VAFDFDGTLTTTDTLRMFFREHGGRRRFAQVVVRNVCAGAVRPAHHRDAARESMTMSLLSGTLEEAANQASTRVAEAVIAHHLRELVVTRLREYAELGHRIVIVSASFRPYVSLVAAQLGVADVIATEWESWDGVLTGRLQCPNVRGKEKVRRLQAFLAPGGRIGGAYGDSAGDAEMLNLASRGLLVGPDAVSDAHAAAM